MGYDNGRRLVLSLGTHPSVFWDWWISPSFSTFLLREEFRLMAITPPDWFVLAESWKEAWPSRYPAWSEVYQSYGDALSCLRHKELLGLANARTAKRLAKKARKTAPAQRRKGSRKLPGAWPTYD